MVTSGVTGTRKPCSTSNGLDKDGVTRTELQCVIKILYYDGVTRTELHECVIKRLYYDEVARTELVWPQIRLTMMMG